MDRQIINTPATQAMYDTFHTDLRGEMDAFAAAKDQYLPDRYPSSTAVGVTQLALPELLVEIRAVAVAGCGSGTTA